MSAILDALRKLQRERAASDEPAALRDLPARDSPLQRESSTRGRGLVMSAVGLGALLGGVAFGALVFLGRIELPEALQFWRGLQAPVATSAVEPAPDPISAPAPIASNPQAEAAEERARLEAARAEAARVEAERARAAAAQIAAAVEAARLARAAADPPPEPPDLAPPALPAPVATPTPPLPEAAPKSEPVPLKKPIRVAKKAEPRATRFEPEPRPESQPTVTLYDPVFPQVRVEKIRWHPLKERRVVTLHFETQTIPDAHEGDIVAGVLVRRIDPGAVELAIGAATKLVRPGS